MSQYVSAANLTPEQAPYMMQWTSFAIGDRHKHAPHTSEVNLREAIPGAGGGQKGRQ